MSNLTNCKDCGHQVSKRAKTCPSCGVRKPAKTSSTFGQFLVLLLIIWIAVTVLIDEVKIPSQSSVSQSPAPPTHEYTPKPRSYTDADIQEAISSSDDYETYQAEFTKAATELLTSRRCGRYEMTQFGGFVKAQGGYKEQPIYFTYCGGNTIANRIYLDVSTERIFK
jgi:hypothetical protein